MQAGCTSLVSSGWRDLTDLVHSAVCMLTLDSLHIIKMGWFAQVSCFDLECWRQPFVFVVISAEVFAEVWADLPLQAYPLGKRRCSLAHDAKRSEVKKPHVRRGSCVSAAAAELECRRCDFSQRGIEVPADADCDLLYFPKVLCTAVCRHNQDSHQRRRGATSDSAPENLHRKDSHHAAVNVLPAERPDGSWSLWAQRMPLGPWRLFHY